MRGDDKNGCWADWLAFCKNVLEKESCFTSYHSNQFNCFFLGAAAIIHRRTDLLTFLTFLSDGYLAQSNLKIDSVKAVISDDNLLSFVAAVAVLYL